MTTTMAPEEFKTGGDQAATIPRTMRALRKMKDEPGLSLEEVSVPVPGLREVLLRVLACGQCGTDLHILKNDVTVCTHIKRPVTIGHEIVGEIVARGAGAQIAIGTRVAVEGHVPCRECRTCRTGEPHLCGRQRAIGLTRDGGMADYVAVPEESLWRIPDSIPTIEATQFDPAGNAVHTVHLGNVCGKTVVITGCGAIGLVGVQVVKAWGGSKIYAVDVDRRKLELAKQLGADETFVTSADLAQDIISGTDGGVDVLLEFSGALSALDAGLSALLPGGVAICLGLPASPIELDLASKIIFKGLTLRGVYGRRSTDWLMTDFLLSSGRIDVSKVITHVLPLEEYERGFDLLASGAAIKVVYDFGGVRSMGVGAASVEAN